MEQTIDEPVQFSDEEAATAARHIYEVGMGSSKAAVEAPAAAAAAIWYGINCINTNNPFMVVCYTRDGEAFTGSRWWIAVMPTVDHVKLVAGRVTNQLDHCRLVDEGGGS